MIVNAERKDLPDILALQRIAYQSEAALLQNDAIAPLKQSLEEITEEFEQGKMLKAVLNSVLIGSVRAFSDENTCHVAKLFVSPEHQRRGYGARLLSAVESRWPHPRYELFTSSKSLGNLNLYEKMGYAPFREKRITPEFSFIFLEKFSILS